MQTNQLKKEQPCQISEKLIYYVDEQQKPYKDHYETDSDIDESDSLPKPETNKHQEEHAKLSSQNSHLKLYFERLFQVFSFNQQVNEETHFEKKHFFNEFLKSSQIKKLVNSEAVNQNYCPEQKQTNGNNLYEIIKKMQNQCRSSLEDNLLKSKRFQKTSIFTPNIIIDQLQPSNNYEVVKLSVHYLWYATQIFILNVSENSSLHDHCQVSNWGAFGSVYFVNAFDSQFAIKCIAIQKKQEFNRQNQHFCETNLSNHLIAIIKEYFFLLFFSELEIGPKVKTIGGFDMVFYEGCIQFSTEICLPCEQNSMKNQLSQNLFIMHMFQVVHRDIKPSNIMYSPTFKKSVFIDFGCTQIINETLGQKTITQFIGTSVFCTDEVVSLLATKKGAADLYYNDFYGLNASLQKIEKSQNVTKSALKSNQSRHQVYNLKSYDFQLHSLKHSLYFQNFIEFYHLWKVIKTKYYQQIEQIQLKLLSFFSQIKPNQHLAQFYWTQIDETIRDLPSLQWLKIIFKVRHNEFVLSMMRIPQKKQIFALNQMIYKVLHVQNSRLTQNQVSIEKILINRLKAKDKILQTIQNLKQNLLSDTPFQQHYQQFENLCIIVAFYSSFSSNQFHASIDQKVEVCQSALNIIREAQNIDLEKTLVFNTPFQQLSAIAIFYHYFIFKIWRRVPQTFKSTSMVASFLTFCILGYPINNNEAERKLTQAFVSMSLFQQHNHKISYKLQLQNSILYLECRFIVFFFGSMFCKGNTFSNQNFDKQIKHIFFYHEDEIHHDDDNDFLEIYTFSNQLIRYFKAKGFDKESTGLNLDRILKQINSQKISVMSKKYKLVAKWKTLVQITVDEFSLFHEKTNVLKTVGYLYNNKKMFNEYKHTIILPFIGLFGTVAHKTAFDSLFLQKIDEIIGLKYISINFKIGQRLKIAMNNKNIQFLIQIADYFQSKTIQMLQFHLLLMFYQILGQIMHFIKRRYFFQGVVFNYYNIRILKQVFRIYKFFLKTGYDNFYLIDQFFHQKFKSIDYQIDAEMIDLGLENDRLTRDFLFSLLQIGNFFIQLKSEIPDKFVQNENENFSIEQKYLTFITDIKANPIIFFQAYEWSRLISQNFYLKKMFYEWKPLSNKLLNLFMLQRLIVGQISNMQKILKIDLVIESLYEKIEAKKFLEQQKWNKMPPLKMAFEYYQSKLFHSNYDTFWCQEILLFYQICKKKNQLNYVFDRVGIIRSIFNSLIYLQREPAQFQKFFIALATNIKESPHVNKIEMFCVNMKEFFWCKCSNCFMRKPQFWDPDKILRYMYSNINLRNVASYPYMSLVYYFSMTNKRFDVDDNYRKVIKFILKSIPYLTQSAKEQLLPVLNLFVFIINNPQLKTNDIILKLPQLSMQQSQRKLYRQFIQAYLKCLKNRVALRESLEHSVEESFLRERIVAGFKIPEFVRKMYANKIRRFYQVKESYSKKKQTKYQLKFSFDLDFLKYQ